jgi:hypothetical protein
VESHGRVIVLEDDLLVARGFLAYMNEGLRRYADDERVMTITAHAFDANPREPRAVFYPLCTTWGWATWKRAWSRFQEQPAGLERLDDPAFRRSFDLDGALDYSGMMRGQLDGRMDSWGIRWWWSVHHHGGLGLFPLRSLVRNVGAGAGATHTHDGALLGADTFALDNTVDAFPEATTIDAQAWEGWKSYLRRQRPPEPWRARARRLLDRAAPGLPDFLTRMARRGAPRR